ncbi:hypothetical protein H4E62_002396 [Salmonella enterica]|nr:hypothetical protein [Salmonella enterica]EGT8850081.1 hypothetical protein [Salmonella enterica]
MKKITALPVERDREGYWIHPAYDQFCAGREFISTDELNTWLEANGLEWKISYRDYAEGWCAGNDNAIHEIRAAGIKVKGE